MWKLIILFGTLHVIQAADLPVLNLPRSGRNSKYAFTPEIKKALANLINSTVYVNGTDCLRPCDRTRRICYYVFHLENYQGMGAACGNCSQGVLADCFNPQCVPLDGIERGILTINRQIPGPLIEVCQDDLIVVDLHNNMHSESTSIHWHGLLQSKTPYMDGVPYVTQCPINPNNRFRYTMWAEDYGTYFYHSHSGVQRYSGAYGGLIIRKQNDEALAETKYTKDDHVIFITDWSHESPEMFTSGLPSRPPGLLPQTLIINGLGKFFDGNTLTPTPYDTLYVTSGEKYRFRIINSGSTVCPMRVQIQDHSMTVIATDGDNISPKVVNTLVIATGERYDVVIHANKRSGLYWFHVKAIGLCEDSNVFQTAILSYVPNSERTTNVPSAPRNVDGFLPGVVLNNLECTGTSTDLCLTDLKNLENKSIYAGEVANNTIYLAFSIRQLDVEKFFRPGSYQPFFNIFGNNIFLGTINGLSHTPPSSPILSQGREIDSSVYCNTGRIPESCANLEICTCTHVFTVNENELVEIYLIDEADAPFPVVHPMHFHGYKFEVIAQGRVPGNTSLSVDKIKDLDRRGLIKKNYKTPLLKDTLAVQNQGYMLIRLKGINPGAWLLHCHVEDHMVFGMAAVMGVRGSISPVPEDFPKCGNFPR